MDSDADEHAPESCGGNDCDDDDQDIHGDHVEVCDGKDNDCDAEIDPETGSSCDQGMVCVAHACRCATPTILCDGPLASVKVCLDPTNDREHCGSCGTVCSASEECVNGSCECAEGYDVCGADCVDFLVDTHNCGDCGTNCGNAECMAGACVCPNGSTDCSATRIPACVETDSDAQHCGGCGERCLDAGACIQGDCDTAIEWLKIFHGQVSGSFYGQGAAAIDTDAAGNIYIASAGDTAAYQAFPDGDTTLWNGPGMIAKLDRNGELQWAKDSTTGVWQIAVVGDDVWVAVYEILRDSITVAGQTFSRRLNHLAFTAVLKLDAATGEVTDFFQLDYLTRQAGSDPFLLHDASTVWLVQANSAVPQLGDTTWTPPDTASYNTFVYPLGAEQPTWLPGFLRKATVDAAGRLVLQLSEGANTTINFGGEDLVYGPSGGEAVVRLTNQLAHDISFATHIPNWMVAGAASLVFLDGYMTSMLSEFSVTGDVTLRVGLNSVFSGYDAKATPGYIAIHGSSSGGQISGRTFPFGATSFVTYSDSTYALERALTFYPNAAQGIGGILTHMLIDSGQSAILAVRLDDGLTLNRQAYDIGLGYHGLALMKVNLYAP